MPNNADTMKQLSVSNDDFICNRENVLWLLGFDKFYDNCSAFSRLKDQVYQIHTYMKTHGMLKKTKGTGCSGCDAHKIRRAQIQLLRNFVTIFTALYDAGNILELQKVLDFASFVKARKYNRMILAVPGKIMGTRERLIVVE